MIGKLFSAARAFSIGKNVSRKFENNKRARDVKQVPTNFKKGMPNFAEVMATEFLKSVAHKVEPNYVIELLGIEMTGEELTDTIAQNGSVVKITNGRKEKYHFQEIWNYFEYGRLDSGITPDPILKKIFIEFKPVYVESLKRELTKKRGGKN